MVTRPVEQVALCTLLSLGCAAAHDHQEHSSVQVVPGRATKVEFDEAMIDSIEILCDADARDVGPIRIVAYNDSDGDKVADDGEVIYDGMPSTTVDDRKVVCEPVTVSVCDGVRMQYQSGTIYGYVEVCVGNEVVRKRWTIGAVHIDNSYSDDGECLMMSVGLSIAEHDSMETVGADVVRPAR